MEVKVAKVSGATYEEALANAKIIAAAPELLDALKDAEAEIACAARSNTHVLEKVRAIIAKATA
jgi:hypothetical protein